jgi:hypothetical protein
MFRCQFCVTRRRCFQQLLKAPAAVWTICDRHRRPDIDFNRNRDLFKVSFVLVRDTSGHEPKFQLLCSSGYNYSRAFSPRFVDQILKRLTAELDAHGDGINIY